MNVWSHLIGFVVFATLAVHSTSSMLNSLRDEGANNLEIMAFKDRFYLLCYEVRQNTTFLPSCFLRTPCFCLCVW